MAGCGGGSDEGNGEKLSSPAIPKGGPGTAPRIKPRPKAHGLKPVERPELEVARLAKAVSVGDCDHLDSIFREGGMTTKICRKLIPAIRPVLPPQVKRFGSGAVVRNADGGRTILTLDRSRRFKYATSFSGGGEPPVVPVEQAVDAMGAVTAALRRDNCEDLVSWSLTYKQNTGRKFCASPQVRRLRKALQRDQDAEPRPLGGDGSFAFYALRVKPRGYFTLVFAADRSGTAYLFVEADPA